MQKITYDQNMGQTKIEKILRSLFSAPFSTFSRLLCACLRLASQFGSRQTIDDCNELLIRRLIIDWCQTLRQTK